MNNDNVKDMQNSINEYENELIKLENNKIIKYVRRIIIGIVGIIILKFVLDFCLLAFSISLSFGILSIFVCLFVIIYIFVYPIIKLFNANKFRFNNKKYSISKINKHNDEICYAISNNIIDFNKKVPNSTWYDNEEVKLLKEAVDKRNIEEVRLKLTNIINTSIKKSSNGIIVKYSVQAGLFSAISQFDKLDAILIFIVNLLMIKDIVFLFGFRPNIVKMIRTYVMVLSAAAYAYGLQSNVGKGITKGLFSMIKGLFSGISNVATISSTNLATTSVAVPIALIAKIAQSFVNVAGDSAMQGMANGAITAFIGYQTISILNKEYKLQDNLKNIDLLDDDKEFKSTCDDIKIELAKNRN